MHFGANVFTQDREVFAKLRSFAQIGNRSMSRVDFLNRGGRKQPPGQDRFTGPGARGAEQLEKRSLAKQIKIARIGMGRIEKTLAGLSGSHPAVLEASQT